MSDKLEQAIVRVYDQNRYPIGTGILVSKQFVLTCAHVVAQALYGSYQNMPPQKPNDFVTIDFPIVAPLTFLQGIVICWIPMKQNGEGDIAVLELTSNCPNNARPVNLVQPTNTWGHTFRTFGCPRRHHNGLWVSGQIKGRQADGWLQIESNSAKSIEPGFSGGGVWDEQLNGVSGIVVRMEQGNSTVAYIIPTDILVANCEILKKCMIIPPKKLGDLYKVTTNHLQTQLAFYRPRLSLSREDDLLATALILLVLKSFNEATHILTQLLRQNPLHTYAWYLYAIANLRGRPLRSLQTRDEALAIREKLVKSINLDNTQSSAVILLMLLNTEWFEKKGFKSQPTGEVCLQLLGQGKISERELLILYELVPGSGVYLQRFLKNNLDSF